MSHTRALVLFSGGQDSATCLAWALARYEHVETVGFDYRQRHRVELQCREAFLRKLKKEFPRWAPRLGPDHLLDLGILGQVSDTALTADKAIEFDKTGLPNTFVPGRNLIFFTFAAALAYRRGLSVLVGGMCETDYSGYPGLDTRMVVETPLMWIDKAATWRLAKDLGGDALVALIKEDTHTCYIGDHSTRHDWGYGCGTCPACKLRAKGYAAFAPQDLQPD